MFVPCPYCGKTFDVASIDEHKMECEADPIDPPPTAQMAPTRAQYLLSQMSMGEIPMAFRRPCDLHSQKKLHSNGMTEQEFNYVIRVWEQMPGGQFAFINALQVIAQDAVEMVIGKKQ